MTTKKQVDIGILDFSKAFVVVSHRKLLAKLQHYGVRRTVLTWITEFLTGRSQRVVIDSIASRSRNVYSGMPQGTCLGPILFIYFYINDITVTSHLRCNSLPMMPFSNMPHQSGIFISSMILTILDSYNVKEPDLCEGLSSAIKYYKHVTIPEMGTSVRKKNQSKINYYVSHYQRQNCDSCRHC